MNCIFRRVPLVLASLPGFPDFGQTRCSCIMYHLAWAGLAVTLMLAILGFRPIGVWGYAFGTSSRVGRSGSANHVKWCGNRFESASGNAAGAAYTDSYLHAHRLAATATPLPPTPTRTPTNTLIPSKTPTITLSPVPTPVWAKINAGEYSGALIRKEPSPTALVVKSLLNGMLVEVLPEVTENQSYYLGACTYFDGIEGWIVRGLLVTATPQPGW